MFQLSLNNLPNKLFPQPVPKSNYEFSYLMELRKEQNNQFIQDHQGLFKDQTPNRKDISRQKRISAQQNYRTLAVHSVSHQVSNEFKSNIRKTSDFITQENSIQQHHYSTIDCSVNQQQLNKQIQQEQQFQIKQNQMQQMIREKLYTSYCNSMRKQTKMNKILTDKISSLAPFISQDKNLHEPKVRRLNQFLKFRSQSIPITSIKNENLNSIQRINSQQRDIKKQQIRSRQIKELKPEFQNKDAERIIRKLKKKTKKLLNTSFPELNRYEVLEYQKSILQKVELRPSTKQKLVESFEEIMESF